VHGSRRRLLDEVDLMTSVSGGSFVAAYYGVHREKLFTDFTEDFLYRDIDSYIWGTFLLPWNWEWMVNPAYGTNDRMQEIYDEFMFHGATYADLLAKGSPLVSINATDVVYETVFPFTQDQFDLICSDLTEFPVARSVAASNGFPVLFTPITLISYSEQCGGRVPKWVRDASRDPNPLSRRTQLAHSALSYLDPAQTSYVHLMDGGIADNLAMRSVTNNMLALDSDREALRALGVQHAQRILLISADGQSTKDTSNAKKKTLTGLDQIFDAVSGTQIDAYNFETMILANEELEKLKAAIVRERCADRLPDCKDVRTYFVHLSLAKIADPAVRAKLDQIPTGLTLAKEDVDLLTTSGETLVRKSATLRDFANSLSKVE
jgi:NTE family protein